MLQFWNFMKMRFNFQYSQALYSLAILRANWLGDLLKASVTGAVALERRRFCLLV